MSDAARFPPLIQFLESLGFRIEMDEEGRGNVLFPDQLSARDVAEKLCQYPGAIDDYARRLAKKCMQQFVGGPMSGMPHNRPASQRIIVEPYERARWLAHYLMDDGRAIFVGEARSEKEAKKLAWDAYYRSSPARQAEFNASHFKDGPLAGRLCSLDQRNVLVVGVIQPEGDVFHIYRRTADGFVRYHATECRREIVDEIVRSLEGDPGSSLCDEPN